MYEIENKMVVDWFWNDNEYYTEDPEMVEDILSIDDEIEDLEEEFGSMDEVDEFTLAEIVAEKTGIDPESVCWDEKMDAIVYTYYEEVA